MEAVRHAWQIAGQIAPWLLLAGALILCAMARQTWRLLLLLAVTVASLSICLRPVDPRAMMAELERMSAAMERIPVSQARSLVDRGRAVLVDVRTAVVYQMSHVDGALNVPANQVTDYEYRVPRDKLIICYCS